MSIYRRTDRVPLNDVTVTGTTHAPDIQSQSDQDARKRRVAEPAVGLLRPTANWVSTLRPEVRPNALLAKFPRIANLIAALWRDPKALRRYIDDLLVDKRGNRKGFPLDILSELFALRAYYDELNPQASRPWDVMNNGE